MISRKDGPFVELFTATRWLDVLLCTSGPRWTSPTSLTDHVWASRNEETARHLEQLTRTPLTLPTDRSSVRFISPTLSTILSSLQNFILQTISKSATTTMWSFNTVFLWLYLSVQICWYHSSNHVTLVMFQSVYFMRIFICNASNARIGLPIGANS